VIELEIELVIETRSMPPPRRQRASVVITLAHLQSGK
jgi:hypothetical protein